MTTTDCPFQNCGAGYESYWDHWRVCAANPANKDRDPHPKFPNVVPEPDRDCPECSGPVARPPGWTRDMKFLCLDCNHAIQYPKECHECGDETTEYGRVGFAGRDDDVPVCYPCMEALP